MFNLPVELLRLIGERLSNSDKISYYGVNRALYAAREGIEVGEVEYNPNDAEYIKKYKPILYVTIKFKYTAFHDEFEKKRVYLNEDLRVINDSEFLKKMYALDASGTHISDPYLFRGVRVVNLSGCKGIVNYHPLIKIQELDLSNTDISDITPIKDILDLKLSGCHNIKSIPDELGAVCVDLSNCQGLEDVTNLSRVRDLNLNFCQKIKNIDALLDVHELSLKGCKNIEFPKDFIYSYVVNLSHTNVKDVAFLSKVSMLNLANCPNITDVSPLKSVSSLDISYTNVSDISMLTMTCRLNVFGCRNIRDVSMFRGRCISWEPICN